MSKESNAKQSMQLQATLNDTRVISKQTTVHRLRMVFPVIVNILLLGQCIGIYSQYKMKKFPKSIYLGAVSGMTISIWIILYNTMFSASNLYKRYSLQGHSPTEIVNTNIFLDLHYHLSAPVLLYAIVLGSISIQYDIVKNISSTILPVSIIVLISFIWTRPQVFKYTQKATPKFLRDKLEKI